MQRHLAELAEPTKPESQPAKKADALKPKPWGARSKWNWWGPVRVTPKTHRATALRTSSAYPFLGEVGLGTNGVWMGKLGALSGGGDFVFDPYELYAAGHITGTSMVWLGTVGTGKSAGAKAFATRMTTHGVKVAVASDPKGEWAAPARAVGGVVVALSPSGNTKLNPLDEGPRDSRLSDLEWEAMLRSRRRLTLAAIIPTLINRALTPQEHTVLDLALTRAVATAGTGTVTIRHVYQHVVDDADLKDAGLDVGHGLRRLVVGDLAGVFDGESTVKFDTTAPMVVMDTSGFMGASATLLSVATTCVASWLEAAVMDPAAGRRIVIYDEGWRMLRDEMMLLRMSEQWKLARQYGLVNLLIMHRLTDLDMVGDQGSANRAIAQGLLTDAEIRIVYRQEEDVLPLTKQLLGLTDAELHEVANLPLGVGLWKIGKRPFIVRNNLTEAELEVFNTSSRFTTTEPTPATVTGGWIPEPGEQSAEEEYRILERTYSVSDFRDMVDLEQVRREREQPAPTDCLFPATHEATSVGRFCIQCGAYRVSQSEWAPALIDERA